MTKIKTGDTFPSFCFTTHLNHIKDTSGLTDEKTVFWFLRYIGCTICRYDVELLKQQYESFQKNNTGLYVVMQSDAEHIAKNLAETNTELPFEMICDPEMKIYKELSILPAESTEALSKDCMDALKEKVKKARKAGFAHGDYEGDELQLPALFIVGKNGETLYAHYAENIMDMPSVEEVIALL